MKRFFTASLLLLSTAIYAADKSLETDKQKFSYAIGYQVGQQLKGDGLDVDAKALSQAILDVINGDSPKLTVEEMQGVMTKYQEKRTAQQSAVGERNLAKGKSFLEENKGKDGITALDNGMQYKVITKGTGKQPKASDTVTVHYRGTLIDGTEFDSSYSRNEPATFPLGNVIKGWQEILPLMKTGSKWQIFIPSDLAYGARGAGASIGPNETLIFEIELVSIKG